MFLNSLCATSDEMLLSFLGFNSERVPGCGCTLGQPSWVNGEHVLQWTLEVLSK